MNDTTNIWFIYTHTEGNCSNHYLNIVVHEGLVSFLDQIKPNQTKSNNIKSNLEVQSLNSLKNLFV